MDYDKLWRLTWQKVADRHRQAAQAISGEWFVQTEAGVIGTKDDVPDTVLEEHAKHIEGAAWGERMRERRAHSANGGKIDGP